MKEIQWGIGAKFSTQIPLQYTPKLTLQEMLGVHCHHRHNGSSHDSRITENASWCSYGLYNTRASSVVAELDGYTGNALPPWTMKVMLALVPIFRYFPYTIQELWRRLGKLYGIELIEPGNKDYITMHNDWLKRAVPPERVHFFSVKEGREPLCKILDVLVPDAPFPWANEQAAMKKLADTIMSRVYLQ